MPQLTSPLSTPAGMSAVNAAHVGKMAGTRLHFPTFAAFTAAITPGATGYSADLWADGQEMTIASEAGVGAIRVWRTSLAHARTVRIGPLFSAVLAADTNTVLVGTGTPTGGANGDLWVGSDTASISVRASGAWAFLAPIAHLTAAQAAAVVAAIAAGGGSLTGEQPMQTVTYTGNAATQYWTAGANQTTVLAQGIGSTGGGGGGHPTGGGGSGAGAGELMAQTTFQVVPNRRYLMQMPVGGVGGAIGANGSAPTGPAGTTCKMVDEVTGIPVFEMTAGAFGLAGLATGGAAGGNGSAHKYLAGGAAVAADTNGSNGVDSNGAVSTQSTFGSPGAAGGSGAYVSAALTRAAGRGGRTTDRSYPGPGGTSTASAGGLGGGGAGGWPGGVGFGGGLGGNDDVAGGPGTSYGSGGGGGGRNKPGGNGADSMVMLTS